MIDIKFLRENPEIVALEECACKISDSKTSRNATANSTAIYRSSAVFRASLSGAGCLSCGAFCCSVCCTSLFSSMMLLPSGQALQNLVEPL